jgi:inosine-uridine nucleoside N-ribohydrolase
MLDNKVVVIVDNVDPDNLACALAADSQLLGLDVVAVIVTGRAAHPNPTAGLNELSPEMSKQVLRLNTRRMKGFLRRNGCKAPVFEGLIPPQTIVPHKVHINEEALDIHHDATAKWEVDGHFTDAVNLIAAVKGRVHLVVGGPLTEVAALMSEPRLTGKLGIMTTQLGMFGFGDVQLMAGGRKQFNAVCDPEAVRKVLSEYPEAVYMVSTDITKATKVGFDNPDALRGMNPELVAVYAKAFPIMLAPRGERIYIHDIHATFLMGQLLNRYTVTRTFPLYSFDRVQVTNVSDEGEIDIDFQGISGNRERYVTVRQQTAKFHKLLKLTIGDH